MLSRYFRAYSHRSIGVPCFWMINDEYHLDFVLEDVNTKDVFLVGTTEIKNKFHRKIFGIKETILSKLTKKITKKITWKPKEIEQFWKGMKIIALDINLRNNKMFVCKFNNLDDIRLGYTPSPYAYGRYELYYGFYNPEYIG